MKKKILWSDFLNPENKIAINLRTREEDAKFMNMLNERGVKWASGHFTTELSFFEHIGDSYCVRFNYGLCWFSIDDTWNYYTIHKLNEVEFVDSIETIAVEINPNSISQAYKAVEKAINEYKKKQSEFTKEEINKANEISEQMIVRLFRERKNVILEDFHGGIEVELSECDGSFYKYEECKHYSFKNKDSYNTDIAICVCLCKLTNTEIPDFIKSKLK